MLTISTIKIEHQEKNVITDSRTPVFHLHWNPTVRAVALKDTVSSLCAG